MFESLDFVFPTSASTKSLNNHGPPGAADFLLRMDGAGGGDELAAVAFLKGCPMSERETRGIFKLRPSIYLPVKLGWS